MAATRRLAAILAADVAGYSRLIGVDEEGTLGRLRVLRAETIDPMIAAHNGRLVKTTGDGLLVEFASVVDALRCAAELQADLAEGNAALSPDRRIEFRIGINWATSSSRMATSLATASTWLHASKRSRSPAGSASAASFGTKCETGSITPSRIWASGRSRTLRGRCGSIRCAAKPLPICRQ